MKVLIVEDELMAQKSLARTLTAQFDDMEIVGMTSSVASTIEWLSTPGNDPDIIFMDVELSDGDCFEIFRQQKIDASVIMTTAYDNYAVKAFEQGSLDYLLKPIEIPALKRAVERCRQRTAVLDVAAILSAIGEQKRQPKERFLVYVGEQIIPVKYSDVAYFFSEDKANYVTLNSGGKYIIDSSIEAVIDDLDHDAFFRISRGFVVSRNCIKTVSKHLSGRLKLKVDPSPSFEVTVARARVDDFLKWLE